MTTGTDARRSGVGYERVLVAVSAGGVLGVLARYAVTRAVPPSPAGFPWGTFLANLSGAFLLGIVVLVVVERFPTARYARPFVAIGVLGAYTTFSSFAVEAVLLVRDHEAEVAVLYVAATVLLGLVAAALGVVVGRRIGGSPRAPGHGAAPTC